MYCKRCQREVVILGIGLEAASEEKIEALRRGIEQEGKYIDA
jgi:hypothetical protein